jgi:predicted dehydrogenase/nucleoside-diphosphate-sugar epimerase
MRTDPRGRAESFVPLRVALVGCGRIADVHVEALRPVPDAILVACCDLDVAVARAFASKHGIPRAYADVETMLIQSAPDVVHLLTPPESHRALVEACAHHGAHVYVEKPLASNEADARAILEAAEAARIQVCPGHNRLFDPQFLEMRRRVESGEIGRVLAVRAEQGFEYESMARSASIPWSYGYGWGIYENLIPHALYLVTHFLACPGPPLVVGFDLGAVREAAVEEIRVLIPSHSAVGEVVLSMNAAPQRVRVEVVGTRGSLTADYVGLHVTGVRLSGMPGIVRRLTAGFDAAWQHTAGSIALILGVLTGRIKTYMGLRRLVPAFYRALREGTPPPVRAEEGLVTVRLMEQIRSALAEKEKPRLRVGDGSLPARALVTGATGFLGGRLIECLAQAGVPTRATTRIVSRARVIQGVEWVRCDLASENDLRRAMAGVETVFHCAAMAGPPGSLQEYEETNVQGTLRVAKLAEEAGVRNLVYVSSISVYAIPPRGERYLDEGAAYDARADERGFYTQSKLGADRALLTHARENPRLRIVVLRPGTLYGPGAPLPIGRLELPSPFQGRPLVAGSPRIPMPLSFVDNVVDAMLAAERTEVPSGSVFNVVDDPECNQGLVAAALVETSQGRIRPRFVPYPLVWLLMLVADVFALVRRGKLGTARYRLARTLAEMRYPCLAARERLHWTPRVSLIQGLARVVTAMRQRPYPH